MDEESSSIYGDSENADKEFWHSFEILTEIINTMEFQVECLQDLLVRKDQQNSTLQSQRKLSPSWLRQRKSLGNMTLVSHSTFMFWTPFVFEKSHE